MSSPDKQADQFAGQSEVNGRRVETFWHDTLVAGWWWKPVCSTNKAFGPHATSRGAMMDAISKTTGA